VIAHSLDLTESKDQSRNILGQIRSIRATTERRAQTRATSTVNRFVMPEAQESRIRLASRDTQALEEGARLADKEDYMSIERARRQTTLRAQELGEQIRTGVARGDSLSDINKLGSQMHGAENEAAAARRAMMLLKQRGLDPESKLSRIYGVTSRAMGRQDDEATLGRAESDPRSMSDIKREIDEAAQALKELSESFRDGKMSLEEFNQKAGEAAQKYERLADEERAAAQVQARRFDRFQAAGGAAHTVLGAGARLAQAAQIDQRLTSVNAATGIAGIQNQQFSMLDAAMRGDQASFGFLMGDGMEMAANFQSAIAGQQEDILKMQVGRGVLGSVLGGVSGAVKGARVAGKFGAAIGGITGAADEATNAAITAADIRQQATTGQASVAAFSSMRDLALAMDAVPAQFRQQYSDFAMNMRGATLGAGGDAEHMLSMIGTPEFGTMLQNARMSPEQFARLTATGVEGMGTAFGAMDPIFLRGMEQAGMGGMDVNMQRSMQMANVGATSGVESLRQVMEEAITRGFDNSKSVGLMVDATVQMSQRSGLTGLGIDAAGGMASLLMRTVGERDPNRSEVAQITAARTAIGTVSDMLSTTEVSLANMERMASFSDVFAENAFAQVAAGNMTLEDMEILRRGSSPNATDKDKQVAEFLARERGMTDIINPDGSINRAKFDDINKAQTVMFLRGGSSGLGYLPPGEHTDKALEAIEAIRSGDISGTSLEMHKQLEDFMGKDAYGNLLGMLATSTGNKMSGIAALRAMAGVETDPDDLENFTMKRQQNNGSVAAADEMATRGAVAGAAKLKEGASQLGDIQTFNEMMKPLENMFLKHMPEWTEAMEKSVSSMRNNVKAEDFENLAKETQNVATSFRDLNTVLSQIMQGAGINTDPGRFQSVRTRESERTAQDDGAKVKRGSGR
jgi:hypothetical protein